LESLFRRNWCGRSGEFVVQQPEFFVGLAKLVSTEPLDSWKALYESPRIQPFSCLSDTDFVDANFDFYGRTLSGNVAQRPRWKRVQGATNDALSEAIGEMYVKKYFPPEASNV
jgi:putative endopeptidase